MVDCGRLRQRNEEKEYEEGDYYGEDDAPEGFDFDFVFTPVLPECIVPAVHGMGGRSGRSLEELRFNKVPPVKDNM